MKDFVKPGHSVGVAAPYALTAGDGCLIGALFGVAATDATDAANPSAVGHVRLNGAAV